MISLRFHIVSITAVFLALGLGIAFGSTFIEKATIDTLNAQLDSLEGSLGDRDSRIDELESVVATNGDATGALDEEGDRLLAGMADGVPVVLIASRGVDQNDVNATVQTLGTAGAQVQGIWWLTDRFRLDDDGELSDLAEIVGVESTDPARLRRAAIEAIGAVLHTATVADAGAGAPTGPDDESTDGSDDDAVDVTTSTTEPTSTDDGDVDTGDAGDTGDTDGGSDDETAAADLDAAADEPQPVEGQVAQMLAQGFIDFESVSGSDEDPGLAAGTRPILVGGSNQLADDVVLAPLVEELGTGDDPVPSVLTSARDGDGEVADVVAVVRQDDDLRGRVTTVGTIEHFTGRAALVLSLVDLADGVYGHYGVGEGSTGLLPTPTGS